MMMKSFDGREKTEQRNEMIVYRSLRDEEGFSFFFDDEFPA